MAIFNAQLNDKMRARMRCKIEDADDQSWRETVAFRYARWNVQQAIGALGAVDNLMEAGPPKSDPRELRKAIGDSLSTAIRMLFSAGSLVMRELDVCDEIEAEVTLRVFDAMQQGGES